MDEISKSMRLILFLFLFFLHQSYIAQEITAHENEVHPKVKGLWYTDPISLNKDINWKAHWIWMDEEIKSDVMLARHSFDIDQSPRQIHLLITASSQYQLYINGEYICQGPARSAPHHQSFDVLDIGSLIRQGKNILAVRVHHQKGKRSYHHQVRGGLLAQLDMKLANGDRRYFYTDTSWKVSPDHSWSNEAPKISRFQLVVNDRVDLRKKINDWYKPVFDDSQWTNASPLMRNVGWPSPQKNARPQSLTPPWTSLIPRDLPYLRETNVLADRLIEARQVEHAPVELGGEVNSEIANQLKSFTDGDLPLSIPTNKRDKPWLILFDFGKSAKWHAPARHFRFGRYQSRNTLCTFHSR